MRRLVFILLLFAFSAVSAQDKEMPAPPQRPDAKTEAQKMTDEMNVRLKLDEKQYKKVYKINLKFANVLFPSGNTGGGEMGGPGGGMGRPGGMGGGPQGGMGGGPQGGGMGGPQGGGMPGGSSMSPAGGGMPREQGENPMAESMNKAKANREKALQKILTEEQFDVWNVIEMEREQKQQEREEEQKKYFRQQLQQLQQQTQQ